MRQHSGLVFLVALVLAVLSHSTPSAAATIVIHAGHLIAEPGKEPTTRQSIVIDGEQIVAVEDGFIGGDEVIDLSDSWVMPGLIDMHTHITGVLDLARPAESQIALAYLRPPAEQVLSMLPRVKTLLMNGFTTIRSLGDQSSTTYYLRNAINSRIVVGPRMFVSEPQIEVDGGDLDAYRWDVRHDVEQYVSNRGNCTGVVECTKVVRQEVRRGADVIKLRQSGLAVEDSQVTMVESEAEVKAIIDTAHQLNRRVAAHVAGTPAFLQMVIAAGADTIEHGPLNDAAIALMKKQGTSFTPTLLAAKMIDYRFGEATEYTGKAYRAGVSILYGTDLGIMDTDRSHEEFGLLVAAGIPPAQVLRTATINAARALGRGEMLGSIVAGRTADVVAMKVDPFTHMDQLGVGEKMSFVMKAGEVFKDVR